MMNTVMALSEDKNDMSMEEILSSIRRYVSDGNTSKPHENSVSKAKSNVIQLSNEIFSTDSMSIKSREFQATPPKDVILEEAIVAKNNLKSISDEQGFYVVNRPNNSLKETSITTESNTDQDYSNFANQNSFATNQATSSSNSNPFDKLRSEINSTDSAVTQSPSLDLPVKDLLNQMASPLIKSWLDENLRQIVEQIVEREVQKIKKGF